MLYHSPVIPRCPETQSSLGRGAGRKREGVYLAHHHLPVAADGFTGALLVDPWVRAPVRDDDGTLDPPPAPPPPPPPPPPPARSRRGAGRCGGCCGGRDAGLGLRGPGGACPPRDATTAAAAVFVQLALRWGRNWAAQWHLARAVGKRFRVCRTKRLYVNFL